MPCKPFALAQAAQAAESLVIANEGQSIFHSQAQNGLPYRQTWWFLLLPSWKRSQVFEDFSICATAIAVSIVTPSRFSFKMIDKLLGLLSGYHKGETRVATGDQSEEQNQAFWSTDWQHAANTVLSHENWHNPKITFLNRQSVFPWGKQVLCSIHTQLVLKVQEIAAPAPPRATGPACSYWGVLGQPLKLVHNIQCHLVSVWAARSNNFPRTQGKAWHLADSVILWFCEWWKPLQEAVLGFSKEVWFSFGLPLAQKL